MAEFEIECRKAARCAGEIQNLSKDLKRQEGRVADVYRQMQLHRSSYGVQQSLSGIADSLHSQLEQLRQYGGTLEHIIKVYEDVEKDLSGKSL